MANMSYCRFQNTYKDLRDCFNNMDDTDLSVDEKEAKYDLIKLCKKIYENYKMDDGDDEDD